MKKDPSGDWWETGCRRFASKERLEAGVQAGGWDEGPGGLWEATEEDGAVRAPGQEAGDLGTHGLGGGREEGR